MYSCEKGRVVKSINGHDAGTCYMVLGEQEGRVLLTDGFLKKQNAPKKKNPKHLEKTELVLFPDELSQGKRVSDEEIRYALKKYRNEYKINH